MGQIENAALAIFKPAQHQRKAYDDKADVRGRQDYFRSRLGADLAELVQEVLGTAQMLDHIKQQDIVESLIDARHTTIKIRNQEFVERRRQRASLQVAADYVASLIFERGAD